MSMPTPDSIHRKSTRPRRSATEVGSSDHIALKASGLYQTATIHDRIQQWQAHGVAIAPSPDAVSVLSAPRSTISTTPEPVVRDGKDEQAAPALKETRTRQSRSSHAENAARIRSASTPRKRVVSDEHWKAKRNPNRDTVSNKKETQREPEIVAEYVPPKTRTERSVKDAKAEREERRRRRVEAKSQNTREEKQGARDPKIGQSLTASRPNSIVGDRESTHDDLINFGEAAGSDIMPRSDARSSLNFPGTPEPEDEDDRPRGKSKYAEILGRPPPAYQDAQLRSKKGSLFNKTKEVLGIADPIPLTSNRLPSIEAWLDDQPDPFFEATIPKVRFRDDASICPPQQPRKQKPSKTPPKISTPDPNQIWDAIDGRINLSQNVDQDDEDNITVVPIVEEAQEIHSPSTLKRRGAKASRLKRHTLTHVPVKVEPKSPADISSQSSPSAQNNDVKAYSKTGTTKLSTIASVESLHAQAQIVEDSGEVRECQLKRKLTTHEDMMTVLSQPSLRKSTRRKRTIKITNHQEDKDVVKQILETMREDETKYKRELKTLIDGVIPVLLQCVLSKSDSVAAAGLSTSKSTTNDLLFSRSIVDMGIALERLKSLHNRIPLQNVDSLFSWCQTSHKAYSEYLKAWRLIFQDVVINLAPLDGSDGENNEVMARDKNGDIVDSQGQRVDVAYLLKRPLVNIRKLGRGLSGLHEKLPDHPVAGKIAEDYRELTVAARTKHQQEKGRLEDEAAADIDATRCRDIRHMGPLAGVIIDKYKRVRARDCFDMTIFHSSGQRMDCKIELIMRDNQHDMPSGGDLLICQIEEAGKWLLFAPVDLSFVSVRKGEAGCDLVLMLRGRASLGQEWRELLALKADEPEAIAEWLIMLGSNPLPPKLSRVPSFLDIKEQNSSPPIPEADTLKEHVLAKVPSSETIDIPIGEPSVLGVVLSESREQRSEEISITTEQTSAMLSMGGGLQKKQVPQHWQTQAPDITRKPVPPLIHSSNKSTMSDYSARSTSTFTSSSLAPMGQAHMPQLQSGKREANQKQQGYGPQVIPTPDKYNAPPIVRSDDLKAGNTEPFVRHSSVPVSSKDHKLSEEKLEPTHLRNTNKVLSSNPVVSHATSSTPNENLPHIPKIRETSSSTVPLTDTIRETWSALSGFGRKTVSQPNTLATKEKTEVPMVRKEDKSAQRRLPIQVDTVNEPKTTEDIPPPPPQHKEKPVLTPRSRNIQVLGPSEMQKKMDRENGRISHSPLRKEYNPSSGSNSEHSDSEPSSSSDDDSQTSTEFYAEHHAPRKPRLCIPDRIPSMPTTRTQTLAPSDSASQGPYRRVPSSANRPNIETKRAIAMVCSWNDKGCWDPLVGGHCSIVVSPGLIEAFMANEAPTDQDGRPRCPLAAFELTPIVPLRRPTGLDINIRSPPTPESQIQTSNNIMFRLQTPAECEALYQMINWARCNNPTYIELERSRPRPQPAVTFSNQEAPRPRSWFSFGGAGRRNSYRVGNIPPSSMGESQATTNTVSSAMSALRRLTKSSSFNVKQSSVVAKQGFNTSVSLYSSSNGTGMNSGASTPPPSQLGMIPGRDGPNVPPTSDAALNGGGMVHNMRIRLQVRVGQDWTTVGLSRLTVLPAVKSRNETPHDSPPNSSASVGAGAEGPTRRRSTIGEPTQRQYRLSSSNYTPHRLHGGGREKRVVVTSEKDPSKVLLDATLGESCFERLSQLGIAVRVWNESDEVRDRGGVGLGKSAVYLFQFFQAKECAWVFQLVGKYRYGATGAE